MKLSSPTSAAPSKRFIKEIQLAARVQHPNIATAYAAFRAGGALVLAMEFGDGVSLAELVRRKGSLRVAHACAFARQVALGLQRATSTAWCIATSSRITSW